MTLKFPLKFVCVPDGDHSSSPHFQLFPVTDDVCTCHATLATIHFEVRVRVMVCASKKGAWSRGKWACIGTNHYAYARCLGWIC